MISNAELDRLIAELRTHPLAEGELRQVKEGLYVSLNQSQPKDLEGVAQPTCLRQLPASFRGSSVVSFVNCSPRYASLMAVLDKHASSRKLAAILSADIAGYSAMMGSDEEGTVRKLQKVQEAVLPLIERFGGRVIDLAGDGILAEFSSAVRAVESAAESKAAWRN